MDSSSIEILLVEDNPNDVELTLRALKKHNLANKVVLAKDGEEALEFLFSPDQALPKVVFLDLKLPKVDGLEVLHKIKSDERTKTVPVVILTSSQEERDLVESYRLGVNSYIVKPVNFESFVKAEAELGLYWVILNKLP